MFVTQFGIIIKYYSQGLNMLVPPGSIHLHKHSSLVLHLPLWVSEIGQIKNSQSSVAGARISLGENHFPANSLWEKTMFNLY
jgi:hypothetical protein